MILLIDNYDSFTYNLYQYLCELGADVVVKRNDEITVEDAKALGPERIVISPGPCTPREAGISVNLIQELAGDVPILGVCLGHQSLGAAFGAEVVNAPELMHGKTSMIHHDNKGVFSGLPNPFIATRYHSLVLHEDSIPPVLQITARADDGVVMGLRHREYDIEGVQFHPESILTTVGKDLLANFIGQRALAGAVRGY